MRRPGYPWRALALVAVLVGLAALRPAGVLRAATLTVTNTNDSGLGSLRQAVADATAGDTIGFGVSGTITLGSTIALSKNLTIDGSGQTVTISGGSTSDTTGVRVFVVNTGVTVMLNDLAIASGNAGTDNFGGGIENEGTLTVTNSTFSGNTAFEGGGIDSNNPSATLSVANSTFSGNTASGFGGGINNFGTLSVINSTFSGNGRDDGGGIANGGAASVTSSTFSGNSAGFEGGGIDNSNTSATLRVANSTFSGNSAFEGGGIFNAGTLSVANSTFGGNSAPGFSPGDFNDGGGIGNAGTLSVANSTFGGNSTSGFGGAIGNGHHEGGGAIDQGTLSVANSTFSGNSASTGGGIGNFAGTIMLAHSVVANSPSGGNCGGGVADKGGNLADDATCKLTQGNNATGLNLDPNGLQDNGGPTRTIALLPGSVAIDSIPSANCVDAQGQPLTTDQRGLPRPDDGEAACDAGAYEFQDATADTDLGLANVPTDVTVNATGPHGTVVTYTPPTVVDEDSPLPTIVCAPASGSTFPIGTTTVTCTVADGDDTNSPVSASFTVTVKGATAQIGDLTSLVDSFGLPHGLQTSLEAKLRDALAALNAGDPATACGDLTAFGNEVRAQAGKKLTEAQADQLMAAASNIMQVLAC